MTKTEKETLKQLVNEIESGDNVAGKFWQSKITMSTYRIIKAFAESQVMPASFRSSACKKGEPCQKEN